MTESAPTDQSQIFEDQETFETPPELVKTPEEEKKLKKRKKIILIVGAVFVILIILIVSILAVSKIERPEPAPEPTPTPLPTQAPSNMIAQRERGRIPDSFREG